MSRDDAGEALDGAGLEATPMSQTCHLCEQTNSFYLFKSARMRFSITCKPSLNLEDYK